MHSGSRLANEIRPQDILGVNDSISIRALSGIAELPSQHCAKPHLHRAKHGYNFDHAKSIHPVTSSPQSVHTRAELLPTRETRSFPHYHESAPIHLIQSNTREILLHLLNPALDVGPPPTPSLRAPSVRPANPKDLSYLAPSLLGQTISKLPRSLHPVVYRPSPTSTELQQQTKKLNAVRKSLSNSNSLALFNSRESIQHTFFEDRLPSFTLRESPRRVPTQTTASFGYRIMRLSIQ